MSDNVVTVIIGGSRHQGMISAAPDDTNRSSLLDSCNPAICDPSFLHAEELSLHGPVMVSGYFPEWPAGQFIELPLWFVAVRLR